MNRSIGFRKSLRAGELSTSPFSIEPLEPRTLLTAIVVNALGNQVFVQDSGVEQAYLYGVFADDNGTQDLTFSATSSNPAVMTASVSGNVVSITPVAGQSGFARIQMTANDPLGGRASNTIRVQITAADPRTMDVLLGTGSPASIRYTQSNGTAATVSLSGPGSAVLHFGGDNLARAGTVLNGANEELESITLSDTTAATTLNVSGNKAAGLLPSVGHISATGSLGHLNLSNAVLDGDVDVTGALPSINVDYAEGGSLKVGSGAVSIVGKSFVDENFSSSSPVSVVKLLQWTNSDNVPESFTASFVRSVSVQGNFTPGLQLSGAPSGTRTLGSFHVPGAVGGTWTIAGASPPLSVGSTQSGFNATFDALPSLTVKGDLVGTVTAPTIRTINVKNFIGGADIVLTAPGVTDLQTLKAAAISFGSVVAAGNIGDVTVKLFQFGQIFAGVQTPLQGPLPTSAADFNASASIKSVRVTGGLATKDFSNARIAASALGSLQLSDVQTDNSGVAFGVVGQSIGSLVFTAGRKKVTLRNVHDPDTLAAQLAAQTANLGDMTVQIV